MLVLYVPVHSPQGDGHQEQSYRNILAHRAVVTSGWFTRSRYYTGQVLHWADVTAARSYVVQVLHWAGVALSRCHTRQVVHQAGVTSGRCYIDAIFTSDRCYFGQVSDLAGIALGRCLVGQVLHRLCVLTILRHVGHVTSWVG